jgi:hypothetical protein
LLADSGVAGVSSGRLAVVISTPTIEAKAATVSFPKIDLRKWRISSIWFLSPFGYCRAFDQVEWIWASPIAALLYGSCRQKTSAMRCRNTPVEKTSIYDGLGSKTALMIRPCSSSSETEKDMDIGTVTKQL